MWWELQIQNILSIGSCACEGPGAAMLVWLECRQGGSLWWLVGRIHSLKGNVSFLAFSLLLFVSLSIHVFEPHYTLASFKFIWSEISDVNHLVRPEGPISLWFSFTERYLWISGEDMRILIVLIVFFLVWPHYVNFPIVLGYENIKAITHLYEDWMCWKVVMETRGKYSRWLE